MYLISRLLAGPMLSRRFSTSRALCEPRSLVKLRKLQGHYQCEDGRPIWLKAGMRDRILYSSTIVLCFVGVFMVLAMIYDNAKPESWKRPTC